MKKLITPVALLMLLALTFSACRKKDLVERELATMPTHCYNDVMDEDELGVDVGGSCGFGNAAPLGSTCGLPEDSLVFVTSIPSTTGKHVLSCTKTTSGTTDVYTMSLSGGGTVTLRVPQTVLVNTDLTATTGPLADDQCEIDFNISGVSGSCSSTGSSVQMQYNGIHHAINICGCSWYSGFIYGHIDLYRTLD